MGGRDAPAKALRWEGLHADDHPAAGLAGRIHPTGDLLLPRLRVRHRIVPHGLSVPSAGIKTCGSLLVVERETTGY